MSFFGCFVFNLVVFRVDKNFHTLTAIKQMLSIIVTLRNKILNTSIFVVFILPLFSIPYSDREQESVNRMLLTG